MDQHLAGTAHAAFRLDNVPCPACADALEQHLRASRHVIDLTLDWPANTIHVRYHAGMITPDEIGALIAATGCDCAESNTPHEHAEHRGPPAARLATLQHAADVQPITMGTKHDRMQYELLATAAHGRHPPAAAAPAPSAHAGMDHGAMGHGMTAPGMAAAMERDMRDKFVLALALTIPAVLYSPLGTTVFRIRPPTFGLSHDLIMLVLTTPVVWYCGWMFIAGAYHSLRRRTLTMSVLIAVGVLAAWFGSLALWALGQETVFDAAAMLVAFVLFGHWMEMKARRGTNDALRALFDLAPPQTTVIRDGQEVTVASAEVQVGDVVLLRPGDKAPVDGEVIAGETSMDEALVTGESTPVAKRPGDRVIAGALNRSGSIRFRATRVGADTTVAQIAALVEQAQRSKAPGQRVADRAAHYLVLLAVGAGAATFAAWLLAGASLEQALSFAIAAVVIACPDALGLATPTAVAVGTGVGARHNILFKDAAALETLARITTVVLDKTGTLTEGKPTLTDIVVSSPLNAQRAALEPQAAHASAADKHPHDSALSARHAELLWLVASAEQASEHPLAAAIVQEARARGIALAEAAHFEARAGRGIQAVIDGRTVLVGNAQLMAEAGIDPSPLAARAATLAGEGKTPVFVAVDGQAAGLLAIADAIKPTAAETVRRLKELAIKPVMITGDTERTAAAVARQLGIERFFAEVLPADKAAHVRALQADDQRVAMVGDGVNDAPALAQADIGIAIGAGADVAIETADVVLMKSDPLDIVRAFTISRATVRKMRQNLFWAAIYNLLAIPVAAGLLYPVYGIALRPEWAALLMSLSSIIVAVNAVLLRRVERQLDASAAAAPLAPARTG